MVARVANTRNLKVKSTMLGMTRTTGNRQADRAKEPISQSSLETVTPGVGTGHVVTRSLRDLHAQGQVYSKSGDTWATHPSHLHVAPGWGHTCWRNVRLMLPQAGSRLGTQNLENPANITNVNVLWLCRK